MNLNKASNIPTFYSTVQKQYSYKDKSGWINTGHSSPSSAVNLGGGMRYIYNLNGIDGIVYRYNGKENDTLHMPFISFKSVYDVATDKNDNFYILLADPPLLLKFDSLGAPTDSFKVTGLTKDFSGPGLTLLGNTFYAIGGYPVPNELLRGTISGGSIAFTSLGILNVKSNILDIAACPFNLGTSQIKLVNQTCNFSIFPNPASDILMVITPKIHSEKRIQILNYNGQIIYDNQNFTGDQIETGQLSNGIYFIKYSDAKNILISKFVVQHKV
jgi:hypothetical protein